MSGMFAVAQAPEYEFPFVSVSCGEERWARKIGIALGGGFARGIAHIGVLKVLEEEKIPVSCVAGTSVGALVGTIYCSGVSAEQMEEIACGARFTDFARWTISRHGIATNRGIARFLDSILDVKTFEELRIPLAVTATDLATGEPVVLRSGRLMDAVRASCAYPGMFSPVKVNGRLLVDGVLAHPVPVRPLRETGSDPVIAVHLKGRWDAEDGPRRLLDTLRRSVVISQQRGSRHWRHWADVIVEPDVREFKYDDFHQAPDLIRAGENAMRAALPQFQSCVARSATTFSSQTNRASHPVRSTAQPQPAVCE